VLPDIEHDQKFLAILCRTSKRLLSIAQQTLYHTPLHSDTPVSWEKPLQLVEILTEKPDLARHVISLEGLSDFADQLEVYDNPSNIPGYFEGGITCASAWSVAMMAACPNLLRIDLVPLSVVEFELTTSALITSSSSKLTYLKIEEIFTEDEFRQHLELAGIHEMLQVLVLPNLKCLEVAADSFKDTVEDHVRVAQQLTTLNLKVLAGKLESAVSLFPIDSSRLYSIILNLPQLEASDFPRLSELLPDFLRTLSLSRSTPNGFFATLATYGREPGFLSFPNEYFYSYWNLTHLALQGFQGPSISFLRSLVDSSSLLRSIDFTNSIWIPPNVTDQFDSQDCFEEEEAIAVLADFEFLKNIKFGFLPSWDKEAYGKLRETLAEREIEMDWQRCLL
jgi:hypothetical protein